MTDDNSWLNQNMRLFNLLQYFTSSGNSSKWATSRLSNCSKIEIEEKIIRKPKNILIDADRIRGLGAYTVTYAVTQRKTRGMRYASVGVRESIQCNGTKQESDCKHGRALLIRRRSWWCVRFKLWFSFCPKIAHHAKLMSPSHFHFAVFIDEK